MNAHLRYFKVISEIIENVIQAEKENIEEAINKLSEAIEKKQNIFAFGASHASILTQELFYRAGGLVVINPVLEPSLMLDNVPVTATSKMERLDGYGDIIAEKLPIQSGDVVICHSVSGRNPATIDFALKVKEMGAYTIAITNVAYSSTVASRHKSGKKLMDVADLVIDNHGEKGDACIQIEHLDQKVSPTSTVIGSMIVNSIVAGTAEQLIKNKVLPPVFYSANVDGGDERNSQILKEYQDNIFYMG